MNYIKEKEQVVKRLVCEHPMVLRIWEYGAMAAVPTSAEAKRVLCLLMSDNTVKQFEDSGDGSAIKEAEKYLSIVPFQESSMAFFNWVVDEFTTDEGRLPLSGNTQLGGRTIFIKGEEYPIGKLYELYLQSKGMVV